MTQPASRRLVTEDDLATAIAEALVQAGGGLTPTEVQAIAQQAIADFVGLAPTAFDTWGELVAAVQAAEESGDITANAAAIAANTAAIAANTAALANPKSRILGIDPGPVLTGSLSTVGTTGLVNTTAETDLLSVTVPAGLVADGDVLDFDMALDAFNGHTAAVTATIRTYVGATQIYSNGVTLTANGVLRHRLPGRAWSLVRGLTSLRGGTMQLASTPVSNQNMAGILAVANQGAGTLADIAVPDLSAGFTMKVTGQLSLLLTTCDVRPLSAILRRNRV